MAVVATQQPQRSMAAEQAQQADFARNLKRAQAAQQQKQQLERQHAERVAQNLKSSRYNPPPQTDAQKKQALQQRQRWNARMITARKRKKTSKLLSKKYQKIIAKYNHTSWILLYTAAFADAFFDVLTIPILSTVLSICTSLYLNIKLWRMGPAKARNKRRMIRATASLLDLIPIINLIPVSVLIVYKTQEEEKKRVRKAKKALKKLSKI
jgi:hypothetical protein